VDGLGEAPGVRQVRGLGLHPQEVGERGDSQRPGDRVLDSALYLVVALGVLEASQSQMMSMPIDLGPGPGGVERRPVREGQPLGALMSKRSPSLARNSITSATAWG
jgi:hypothetical protein